MVSIALTTKYKAKLKLKMTLLMEKSTMQI